MSIFRVVISFMRGTPGMHFQQERGVLAMTPGQALDDVFNALKIDRTKIYDLKVWVEQPSSLDSFGFDAQYMYAVNSDRSLKDLWNSRSR